jgi:hypothetical protein
LKITCLLALSACLTAPEDDPKAKAREFLELAGGMAAGASAEFQPGALLQLAIVQAKLSKPRSLELFDQAFAASAALPARDRLRDRFQSMTVAELAKVDVEAAIEKLPSIPEAPPGQPDPRSEPLNQIVARLLDEKSRRSGRAFEVIDRFGLAGAYPYQAVASLLKTLPPEDDRCALLFGQALAAFAQRPDIRGLEGFVRQFRPGRPQAMSAATFDSAVRAMARAASEGKGIVEPETRTISTDTGTVSLTDPSDAVLFGLTDLILDVEPGLVERLVSGRPDLQLALHNYPRGLRSLEGKGVSNMVTGSVSVDANVSKAAVEARTQRMILETRRFQEVMVNYVKDPQKAIDAARQIPAPPLKIRALTMIAMNQDANSPEKALPVLEKCIAAVAEIQQAGNRANGWPRLAEAADRYGDRPLSLKLLERGLDDTKALYKAEADPDDPNVAPRTVWASAAAYRAIFRQAAKLLGLEAAALLERCTDPEIQILGRIEMAAAWLDAPAAPTLTLTLKAR